MSRPRGPALSLAGDAALRRSDGSRLFVATLLFASLVVFAVMQILPGDAAQTMLGPTATPEAVAALSHKLGLDLPAPIRYAHWIGGALHGDLGLSYAYGSPIGPLIASSLAVSAPLALMAMALRRNHRACGRRLRRGSARSRGRCDRHGGSQIGIAVPNFWLAILLVLVFAVTLEARPRGRVSGLGTSGAGVRRAHPSRDRAWRRAGGDRDAGHAIGGHRGAE